ncbi:MAG: YceI family protein [Deltaproteobacteria bacterium]|nr:MAG: YceI family protein [Deltaproteobacteria bacterium]
MRSLIPALLLLSLAACVEDVGKGRVAADVQEVTEDAEAEAATPSESAKTLKVDKKGSTIQALGAKITATHPVDFKDFEGEVTLDGDEVTAASFTVTMETLESDHPKLTEHLKNEDFFDVPNHPTSVFKSTEIKKGSNAEGDWTHTVTGNFTIRGNTKRVSFPARIKVEGDKVSADTEFVINRKDFGVVYPGRPDDLVQDNVRMTIKLKAKAS